MPPPHNKPIIFPKLEFVSTKECIIYLKSKFREPWVSYDKLFHLI